MQPSINKIRKHYMGNKLFKERLEELYGAMDLAYTTAANFYEFNCTGCVDNCCFTRFYHHTFIEYFYILDGFDALKPGQKIDIKERADAICKMFSEADRKGLPVRLMCPLNVDSLCLLYQYRPMICRLHGVPHELSTPGKGNRRNPGCNYFMGQHKNKKYYRFDRTSLYMEMATLERDFRQKAGGTDRVKFTVAEMVCGHHF